MQTGEREKCACKQYVHYNTVRVTLQMEEREKSLIYNEGKNIAKERKRKIKHSVKREGKRSTGSYGKRASHSYTFLSPIQAKNAKV